MDEPEPHRPAGTSTHQALTLVVALILWSIFPDIGTGPVLAAYILALVTVNILVTRATWQPFADAWQRLPIGRFQRTAGLAVLSIIPLSILTQSLIAWSPQRQWNSVSEVIADRLALEQTPAISPPIVVTSQPQRYMIYAPEAEDVQLQWTTTSTVMQGLSLGNGLFTVDYDPHGDDALMNIGRVRIDARITVDGVAHSRSLPLHVPQPHPRWLSANTQAGIAATVSEETDELIIVQRDGAHRRVTVGDGPTDCVVFDAGRRIAVSHRYDPELWIISAQDGSILQRHEAGMFQVRLAVTPADQQLAVAVDGVRPGIRFFSPNSNGPSSFLPLEYSPDWITYGKSFSELIVTDRRGYAIHCYELAGDVDSTPDDESSAAESWSESREPILLPRPVVTLSRTADGNSLWLSSTAASTERVEITANHFIENAIHELDLQAWQIIRTHITDVRGNDQDRPGSTGYGVSPVGLSPSENDMLVAFAGSGEVTVLQRNTAKIVAFSLFDDLPITSPHGVADLGQGVWCVTSPSSGTIGVFDGERNVIALIELDDNSMPASMRRQSISRRRGEQTFYETTRSGLACQSCHLHGDTDYGRYNISGNDMSDILSMRGLAGTSPYLRDASHWQLRDLHEVTDFVYNGYRRSVDFDRAQALRDFMLSLPLHLNPLAHDDFEIERMTSGHSAFVKADCQHCHTPPAMTNLGQHPTRLLFPEYGRSLTEATGSAGFVDTPSLRGVVLTPPYLHDGRASSLRDVLINYNRSNRHGNVESLSDEEIADLLHFLERL